MALTLNALTRIFNGNPLGNFQPVLHFAKGNIRADGNIVFTLSDGNHYSNAICTNNDKSYLVDNFPATGYIGKILSYYIEGDIENPQLFIRNFTLLDKENQIRQMGKGKSSSVKLPRKKNLSENLNFLIQKKKFAETCQVKGTVTRKYEIKDWKTPGKSGVFFHCMVKDDVNTSALACFFNIAALKYFSYIQVGKTYLFSNGTLTRNPSSIEIKILFNDDCIVEEIKEEVFEFVPLERIQDLDVKTVVDVCGVVVKVDQEFEEVKIVIRDQSEFQARVLLNSDFGKIRGF